LFYRRSFAKTERPEQRSSDAADSGGIAYWKTKKA